MSTFVTPNRYSQTITIPVSLPQTEMRRGSTVLVASFALLAGQRAEVRSLNLSILRLFTPGVITSEINKPFGLAILGIYDDDQMLCSPIVGVHCHELGTASLNPWIRHTLTAPAAYRVVVTNNTGMTYDTALDFAVAATGCIKIRTNTDPAGSQSASTLTFGVPASVVNTLNVATNASAVSSTASMDVNPVIPTVPPPVPTPDDTGRIRKHGTWTFL